MSRRPPYSAVLTAWALMGLMGLCGCHPQQPFYFHEDGDLSHYLDAATDIDYPDVEEATLPDAEGAIRPFSLENADPEEVWDLTLEEVLHIALANSKVIRLTGGQVSSMRGKVSQDFLTRLQGQGPTVYDVAATETNPRFGPEAALSAFDTQLSSSVSWEKNDSPRNPLVFPGSEFVFPRIAQEDVGSFQAQLRKTAATGGTWLLTHNVNYSKQNTSRLFSSDWNVNLEAEFRQPLLRGAGVQYNRISGPGAIPGWNNGVMIARINTDIALTDFEANVRNLVSDVENTYWDLYRTYRRLDAVVAGRDSGLQTWKQVYVQMDLGTKAAHEEAQARQQYFMFRMEMEVALNDVYKAESDLRYVLGLAATDGRLIRPADEPPTGKVTFDWRESLCEALVRNVALRRQKWTVKRRELELISSKNWLLPRLDAVARYRWNGMGDHLAELTPPPLPTRADFPEEDFEDTFNPPRTAAENAELAFRDAWGRVRFNNAYGNLTAGDTQEWHLGLDFSMPFGFRKEMSGVRHAQLNLARSRAVLQDMELEVSHQLAQTTRDAESWLRVAQTNFNRRIAAHDEVVTAKAKYKAGVVDGTLDRVLDAQRREAEAEIEYYNALVSYAKSIVGIHFRKGSLLEYNGICLAEGPWPGKAYFDAARRARGRDASFYLDYGFTRPKVISRGAYQQHVRGGGEVFGPGEGIQGEQFDEVFPEIIPTPAPVPPDDGDEAAEPDSPALLPDPPAVGAKTAAPRTGAAGSRSAVKNVSHQQPSGPAEKVAPMPSRTKQPQGKWLPSKKASAADESVATSPIAGDDWTASGWKGLHR